MSVTVLIVDDHPTFRHFARRVLEHAGYRVVGEAGDGAEALEAVRLLRPGAVLVDVLLPDCSGLEVASALASRPDPPVVVLTSSRSTFDLGVALRETPSRGFIPKAEFCGAAFDALLGCS
jgi:DNA-binding NarL/FixJ family response regulator